MRKSLGLSIILTLMLVLFLAPAAFADQYPYLTFESSDDFTIVDYADEIATVKAVGLDANFIKHEITNPGNITWTTSKAAVADFGGVNTVTGASATITLNAEGEAIITASYTNDDGSIITCPCNIVVERLDTPVTQASGVKIWVKGDVQGSGIDIYEELIVPLFNLTEIYGPSFDDSDVLKKDPTALHALLYALELEKGNNTVIYGDPAWNWNWVKDNVTILNQGTYVFEIAGDESGWPIGWKFMVNDIEEEKAASIVKIEDNSKVDWAFRE